MSRRVARLPLPRVVRRGVRAWADAAARAGGTAWLLNNSLARGFRSVLGAAVTWGAGLAVYSALIAALTPAARRAFEEQAGIQEFVNRLQLGSFNTEAAFLAASLFTLLPVLTALFATTVAVSWSAEERAGRLELELSCPLPRRRYFTERVAAALLAVLVVVVLTGAGFLAAAWLAGLRLSWDNAIVAVALLALPAWVMAAFGYAVSAWQPRAVAAITGIVLAASFFLDLLAPVLGLPDALRELSVFRLYGQPLTEGARWGGVAVMLGLVALFTLGGGGAFARRDIAK
jgi:ABC-2 type transport system permease protein